MSREVSLFAHCKEHKGEVSHFGAIFTDEKLIKMQLEAKLCVLV
jgi:hypothetical protein